MKRHLVCLLLLLLSFRVAAAVEFDIDSKIFVPPVYYVGDEVELRIRLKFFEEGVTLLPPADNPVEQWIEINQVDFLYFSRDVVLVNIYFVTFKPGKHILPALDLGNIILEGIEVNTQSVTEELGIKKTRPRREQIELPGTKWKIILLILAVVTLPVSVFFLIRYIRGLIRGFTSSRQKELPRNRIRKALHRLVKWMRKMESREFYFRMTESIKDYLEMRFFIPALTLTTREIIRFIETGIGEAVFKEKISGLAGILQYADLVKFGGKNSPDDVKLRQVEEINRIVDAIEEEHGNVEF